MKKIAVSLLVLTLAVLLAIPAMADSITPYASMRLGTFWSHIESNTTGVDDDDDLNMDIARIARFGAKGQVGDIYGVVELGYDGCENRAGFDMTAGGTRGYYNRQIYSRLLYGKYCFGGGTLLVGQDYTPPTYPSSQQGPGIVGQSFDLQNGFIGVGCLWDRRWPQLKVTLDNGFYVCAAQTYDHALVGGNWAGTAPVGATAGGDFDVSLPKMFVGFDYKAEGLYLGPGVGYNTYNYDDTAVGGTFDDDISSYVVFLKGKADLGAVDLKFAAHYGTNLTDFGMLGRTNSSAQLDADGDVEDAKCYGGYVQGSFLLDPATLTVGCGYSSSTNDANDTTDEADELIGYFAQVKIPMNANFFIVPEITYWDGKDNAAGNEDNDTYHVGVLWQMDF